VPALSGVALSSVELNDRFAQELSSPSLTHRSEQGHSCPLRVGACVLEFVAALDPRLGQSRDRRSVIVPPPQCRVADFQRVSESPPKGQVLLSKDCCERDLWYARQRLGQRTILLRSRRNLLERALINSGDVRLQAQCNVVDQKSFALHH
jgi:hypothetical protein